MQKTDAELTTEAQVIRDETTALANTKLRVYNILKNIIDSKPNNSDTHFKGVYTDETALTTAHPAAEEGDYAFVDTGAASPVELWIWDESDTEWVQSGATGGTVLSVSGTTDRITSTGGATPAIDISGTFEALLGKVAQRIDQNNAATTSAQLAGVISDETGSGALVFAGSPALTGTPTVPTAAAGTNTTQAASTAFVKQETVGVQDLFYSAKGGYPRTTNGCAEPQKFEFATSLVNVYGLAYSQTTAEFGQFDIVPPRKWNNGTITVIPHWFSLGGTGTVRWTISGGAFRNDDPLTTALGSAQNSDDTLTSTNRFLSGPETAPITLAGTPADRCLVIIQVGRDPANDTLNSDAILEGITIMWTCDSAIDG